jgi:glycosyltransferase involved in cell wall biosynthesis/predicted O-methyltransferase YrrM
VFGLLVGWVTLDVVGWNFYRRWPTSLFPTPAWELQGKLTGIVRVSGGSGSLRRIAVYGEIDSNLIDGSSVWLQSVCQVLASIDGVEVTLLLRRPLEPERRFLLDELETDGAVEVVDSGRPGLLGPAEALDLLEELDREQGPFDVVLLRGQALLSGAARRESFDGRLWPYAMTGRGMSSETLRALAARSPRLLCQTEAVADELREIVPGANGSLLVLPPMIPDSAPPPDRNGAEGTLRLAYAGKLAPEYCWLETVEAFRALREARPGAELHVLGDKVHRPPDRLQFHEEAMRALRETEGLRWHGAVPRAAVNGLLAECDLALSIRDPCVEAAREISTKVLEYGAAGLPVVLNRAPSYERLLGGDYPLFIDGPEDVAALLSGPALDPQLRATAAAACHAASREFTFSQVAERLFRHLPQAAAAPQPTLTPQEGGQSRLRSSNGSAAPTRVLVAGHDLKFLGPIREAIAATGATVAEDVWRSHTEHDEAASRAILEHTDTILCEWCLGNAVWYSRNKRADQRLVVRMHRMEVYTDHPAAVEIDNVDQIVCVSQHIADEAIERFGWDPAKLRVIPNSVDVDRFARPKRDGARYTLAMVGYTPRRKRLDRALDILEELRRQEPRFRLLLIGQPPSGFDWVVRRPEEVEYFRECFARIQSSAGLRGAVDFEPFTDDLPLLFQRAGFVLSTSDSEGHQVALAEGVASGAVPVILDRGGAAEQYPDRWIHAGAGEAASAVLALANEDWEAEAESAAGHVARWSPERVLRGWLNLLGLPGAHSDEPHASAGEVTLNAVLEDLLAAGEFSHRGRRYPIAHSTSPQICRRYADLIVRERIERVLEIGTLFGFSTLFLAGALAQTGGELDTIDIRFAKRTWSDGQEIEDIHEVAERLVGEAGLGDRVTFHEGDSNGVLARLIEAGRRYGFALIDGSHRFEVALLDFIGVDRMLEVGGYLAMDDVGANVSSKEGLSGGPNRVLSSVLATDRYRVELWSANVAVCKKLRDA